MEQTRSNLLRTVTESYLAGIDKDNIPSPSTVEKELLGTVKEHFDMRNATADKGDRWRMPITLEPIQIAHVMAELHHICRIATSSINIDPELDFLAIYQHSGDEEGTYITAEDKFRKIAREYNYTMNSREFSEVMVALRELVPRKMENRDEDLIAVNNGIFDYQEKKLKPFDPEVIFTAKSHVDYNPNAENIVIRNERDGTDWDVESWMKELSDDPEIVHVLWQIIGAILRPNVRWNKSAWFYSEVGNNGKGTLAELMRNILGPGAYASIPLNDFSEDFMLEPLVSANAIIVDENDVGTYVDKAANLKAIITNDVITINRKFKTPIAYQFFGFMVQCLNEFPRIKDKSDSFYRRQLFIPFEKTFTGRERRYIKSDYMNRPEVLEYVMKRVLMMNYYVLDEPEACKDILEEYMEYNDPIKQFWKDVEETLVWDLVPFTFLYALYRGWMKLNMPEGRPVQRNKFISEILSFVSKSEIWYTQGKSVQVRTSTLMDKPEPMIAEYHLMDWMNKQYKGNDISKMCMPNLSTKYRGIQRYPNAPEGDSEKED